MIQDFAFIDDLHLVRYKDGDNYDAKLFVLNREYRVAWMRDGHPFTYTVPSGFKTDFASIPVVIPKWISQKVDSHIEAAIVHDYLCVERRWTSKIAAEIFLAAMKAAGVSSFKRHMMYRGVLHFGPKW